MLGNREQSGSNDRGVQIISYSCSPYPILICEVIVDKNNKR